MLFSLSFLCFDPFLCLLLYLSQLVRWSLILHWERRQNLIMNRWVIICGICLYECVWESESMCGCHHQYQHGWPSRNQRKHPNQPTLLSICVEPNMKPIHIVHSGSFKTEAFSVGMSRSVPVIASRLLQCTLIIFFDFSDLTWFFSSNLASCCV